eukprot:121237-Chlamydomonas_euryale.AAC.3
MEDAVDGDALGGIGREDLGHESLVVVLVFGALKRVAARQHHVQHHAARPHVGRLRVCAKHACV